MTHHQKNVTTCLWCANGPLLIKVRLCEKHRITTWCRNSVQCFYTGTKNQATAWCQWMTPLAWSRATLVYWRSGTVVLARKWTPWLGQEVQSNKFASYNHISSDFKSHNSPIVWKILSLVLLPKSVRWDYYFCPVAIAKVMRNSSSLQKYVSWKQRQVTPCLFAFTPGKLYLLMSKEDCIAHYFLHVMNIFDIMCKCHTTSFDSWFITLSDKCYF